MHKDYTLKNLYLMLKKVFLYQNSRLIQSSSECPTGLLQGYGDMATS